MAFYINVIYTLIFQCFEPTENNSYEPTENNSDIFIYYLLLFLFIINTQQNIKFYLYKTTDVSYS